MQFYLTRHTLLGFGLTVGLLAAAGCAPSLTEVPNGGAAESAVNMPVSAATPLPPQTCPANDLQYLVGKSRRVLETMRFGTEIRFEEPGQMYTQEFKASRTRIIIGTNGNIERVLCG